MTTFADLKKTGKKLFGDFGAWAFDEWNTLNEMFFNGKNMVGEIIWGSTPNDRSLGYYSATENLICLHKTLMRPTYPTNDLKWKFRHFNKKKAGDVLLHEMIHQSVHQTGGWVGETSHNNLRFVEEVNRIAKLLGMDVKARVIKPRTVQGKTSWPVKTGYLTLMELIHFPYTSRSCSYYYDLL
jgi:hypothetical protein